MLDRACQPPEASPAATAAPLGWSWQDRPTADPFVAGREWRGTTREDGAKKKLRLVERRGGTAIFEGDGFASGAVFRFEASMGAAPPS